MTTVVFYHDSKCTGKAHVFLSLGPASENRPAVLSLVRVAYCSLCKLYQYHPEPCSFQDQVRRDEPHLVK